jgi:cytosine/adenosine deaminase-related metal-dependent hydrolase
VAENRDEIAWARELFPASRSYLAVYDDFGLMRAARHLRPLHPLSTTPTAR